MTTPTTYPYAMIIRLTNKKTKRTEEHAVKVVAYNLAEATVQAFHALCADDELNIEEYDLKILFAGPDLETLGTVWSESMKKGAR